MLLSARGHGSPSGTWWALQDKRAFVVRGTAATSVALVVSFALGFSTPVVADELDERKSALENEISEVQQSMEYLDADIAETIGTLKTYQGQLPAAQQSLTEAQGRVEIATDEVGALAVRVDLAQETKTKITEELRSDRQKMVETRKVIGQIATEAYKNGGVPTNVSLLLGADDVEDFTESMDMVDQALRSQNAAMERLSEQNATNANSQARLTAVEAEIAALKERADAALDAEQAARDTAASEKATVDRLVADTSALSAKLQEQKPVIEAKLASVEQAQQRVNADIAERQRRLIEEARKAEEARVKAEQERLQAEAEAAAAAEKARREAEAAAAAEAETRRREAEAATANKPAPAPVVPQAVAPVEPEIVAPQVEAPGDPGAFGLTAPVSGPISSGFGWRTTPVGTIDFNGTGGYMHTGIDFGVGCGTALYAPAAGEVWYADSNALEGAGNRIVLNHGVIGGNVLATNFYHLTKYVVSVGQRVSAGQLIGYTGTTGNSSGCHLHFETMLNGTLVDPIGLL
ncbi:peptidase M23 [Arthrobacter agilis]|uniref:M23 family metallopeptidase n=1 Tax=Arthrobacter agilis TaxID=37921 RepID=UPI000B35E28B|nr:M23 family metallopeptidase [Arthrobacter agilis]OUM44032.1 peptidase M23 [Arthrobacter agilis]PPB46410.1 peptidase M23 [Arthrobacter agilis]TPV23935.1 peptidase M23 [Arthrobacter agilis]VDR32682.1 Glycyl-glycine endopeptidase ALE-1 precursor [Arthrobacter agilis]